MLIMIVRTNVNDVTKQLIPPVLAEELDVSSSTELAGQSFVGMDDSSAAITQMAARVLSLDGFEKAWPCWKSDSYAEIQLSPSLQICTNAISLALDEVVVSEWTRTAEHCHK